MIPAQLEVLDRYPAIPELVITISPEHFRAFMEIPSMNMVPIRGDVKDCQFAGAFKVTVKVDRS